MHCFFNFQQPAHIGMTFDVRIFLFLVHKIRFLLERMELWNPTMNYKKVV